MLVSTFIKRWPTFTNKYHEGDIKYKAALILMSTAEEMNYHDGLNKPAAVIMVGPSFLHAMHPLTLR